MKFVSPSSVLYLVISIVIPDVCKIVDAIMIPNDFDDLRVSSNQLSGHLNYQSITPVNEQPVSQITNQIGKPLVPFDDQQQYNTGHRLMMQQQQQQKASAKGLRPQWPRLTPKKSAVSPTKLVSKTEETCEWMSLEMFKKKSLRQTELIIRDDEDQLCYVLVMTAYIKSSEDSYFLLNNLKSFPYVNKVKSATRQSSDGSTSEHLSPLNCSAMASAAGISGATSLFLPIHRLPNRSFREEITIVADCGYLVLNTHVDGSFLTLETISFYQNPDGLVQLPITELRKGSARILAQNRSDHLIFSTEGTENSPLFTIPSLSQYTCRNRICLTGNNSVQLILERFELLRLAPYPLTKEFSNLPVLRENKLDAPEEEQLYSYGRFVARTKRHVEAAQPFIALRSSGISVTRCPNPTHPSEPLTTMVDSNLKKSNYTSSKVRAEKRMVPIGANSASKLCVAMESRVLVVLSFIITLSSLRRQLIT